MGAFALAYPEPFLEDAQFGFDMNSLLEQLHNATLDNTTCGNVLFVVDIIIPVLARYVGWCVQPSPLPRVQHCCTRCRRGCWCCTCCKVCFGCCWLLLLLLLLLTFVVIAVVVGFVTAVVVGFYCCCCCVGFCCCYCCCWLLSFVVVGFCCCCFIFPCVSLPATFRQDGVRNCE